MSIFSEQLRSLRNARGLSLSEFAKEIEVSKSSVNMYERGEREPNFTTLVKIANYFNVPCDILLGQIVEGCTSYSCGVRVFRAALPDRIAEMMDIMDPDDYSVVYSAPGIAITVDNDAQASEEDIASIVEIYRADKIKNAPTENDGRTITKDMLKFALWGNCDYLSDDDLDNVLLYADFIKDRKKKKTTPDRKG